jgi:phage terminase large subunit
MTHVTVSPAGLAIGSVFAPIDYRNPDYRPIFEQRAARLTYLRKNPRDLALIKRHYATHKAEFINDWALTIDPRVLKPQSPIMPFLLFPKQIELIHWIEKCQANETGGIMVKSRDVGASWIAMSWAVTTCLFNKSFVVGFGSAKEENVDNAGDPNTLFYKARMFLEWLPIELRCGWELGKHSAHRRLVFPETGSAIIGQSGDNIGRGSRTAVYFVDEAAHLERPMMADASLAATTNCRVDMSSVNGSANSFYHKAHNGVVPRFDFSWRDDPRKDQAWLEKKEAELDPVVFKQEILCDFNANAENAILSRSLVEAAVGLAEFLKLEVTGRRRSALDVADEGRDKNALASRKGVELDFLEPWSGKGGDIFQTVSKAVSLVEGLGERSMQYDADGMGAGVRGDLRVLNEQRQAANPRGFYNFHGEAFRGSGAVLWPTQKCPRSEIKNEDMFANYKAQSWWHLYVCFNESWKARKGEPYDPNLIISIRADLPGLNSLLAELTQPKWKWQPSGKRIVDKKPDDSLSPNLADAVMMVYSPRNAPFAISDAQIDELIRG